MQENERLRKVFITGLGCLSASGTNVSENWQALTNGEINTKPVTAWDLSTWPINLGGELKDFAPHKILPDKKLMKAISMQDAMGLVAAQEAIVHSQIIDFRKQCSSPDLFNQKTGVYVGSPGNKYLQQYDFLPLLAKSKSDMKLFAQELFAEVHPMWLLRILPNNVLAYIGILFGFQGPNHNITNHAVSGTQALIEAFHAIKSGAIERAVVVAYDLGVDPQAMYYYAKLGLLTDTTLSPFDANHSGTILANGAAALILESEDSVKMRAVKPYAELLSGMATTEGAGLFGFEQEAVSLELLIQQIIDSVDISSPLPTSCSRDLIAGSSLAFIIAHGNGSRGSDESEALCFTKLFSEYGFPISALNGAWAIL